MASGGDDLETAIAEGNNLAPEGPWHHYACTYDASTRSRKIYWDGRSIANDTAGGNFVGSGPVNIGRFSSTASSYINGWVDDARIYRTALSDAQVAALIPCFSQAVLDPPSSLQFAGTISVDASQTDACGKPLRYFWFCTSSDPAGCNAFLSAANADGNTHPTAPLNTVAGFNYVIDLESHRVR